MLDKFFDAVDRKLDEVTVLGACLGYVVLIVGSWVVVIGAGYLLFWMLRGIG